MNNLSYIDFLAEFTINSAHPGGKATTEAIFNREVIDSKTKILDVGCGTGETASYLSKAFNCKVFAIERHPIMLEKARERIGKKSSSIKLVEGSIEQLPYKSDSFDYVLIESVLAFVSIKKALNECNRVLKKGGTLILNELILLEKLADWEIDTLKAFYGFIECNVENDWKVYLDQAGFKQIEKLNLTVQEISKVNELELSIDMDPQLFDILDEHERLLTEFKGRMGNIVLRCQK
ncbi:class I SAM-dependent methyltransferase [Alkalihalobacillus deserti]|uniref:class I SAM-dependent methyltransferase n=1 Tax=Alkalihalobacillus deserti TaxID=2879466 RepID=UPI001D15CC23|nr:class I SAM-dependent methyltransferase [Alkalihalobacillus deserti]